MGTKLAGAFELPSALCAEQRAIAAADPLVSKGVFVTAWALMAVQPLFFTHLVPRAVTIELPRKARVQ